MNFFIKNRGSVSIFLVIILVPVIAVCTIFIDVSRIKLAQGLTYSSGDLALNTVLTQYDTNLSDYYGLMASCQSIDEFYGVAEGYFTSCMVSQGISPTLAQKFASDIVDIVKGNADINDFISIDTSNTTATITAVEDANLANPVMLKSEIIEFMKYRAPIELLSSKKGIYSKLVQVQKTIEIMPAETRIQNEKTKYYNAENKLLEKALEIYEDLKVYEAYAPSETQPFDKDYLEAVIKTDMGAIKETEGLIADYKELHRKYVSNWANTSGRIEFESVATKVSKADLSTSGSNVSASAVKKSIENCKAAREAYETAKTNMKQCLTNIEFAYADQTKVNHIQYWVQMEDALKKGNIYEEYVDKLISFLKARAQMIHNHDNRTDGEREVIEQVYNPITKKYEDKKVTEKYDIRDDEYNGTTIGAAYDAEKGAADSTASGYTKEDIYTISANMQSYSKEALNPASANNIIRSEAEKEIKAALDELKEEYAALVTAQELLKVIVDKIPDLEKAVKKYDETYEKWSSDVKNNQDKKEDSNSIRQDYEEIQEIENTDVRVDIDENDLNDFKNRLQNTIDLLQSYRDTIESIQYRGVTIFGTSAHNKAHAGGIYSFSKFESAAKGAGCAKQAVVPDDIPVMQSDLDNYIESTWDSSDEFAGLETVREAKDGNSPKLHGVDYKSDANTPAFDAWLHDKFPDDEKTLAKSKGMLSALKKMMNQLADYATEGFGTYTNIYLEDDVEIKNSSNAALLPSNGTAADSEKLFDNTKDDSEDALQNQLDDTSDSAGKLFGGIDFATLATEGRDNLYATQYIMSMFSYETKALEGIYELKGGGSASDDIYKMQDGGKINPGNADTYYNALLNSAPSTKEGDWWNTKKTFSANKTLTNKMLDKEHCISYGNEVEYILYGDTNEKNGDKIDLTIAFTRYALNLGPVLSVYWKDGTVNDVADIISGMTQGVIPAPLVKLIICLGVCAAESAVDMNYLKAGLPVAFVKSDPKNQLFIQLNLDKDAFTKSVEAKKTDFAKNMLSTSERSISGSTVSFSYSDYLSMYLFVALCVGEDDIYKRTADVIQLNMGENYPELSAEGFRMSRAVTYFKLEASVRVKPMMMALPYAQQSGIEVLDTDTWNTFTYEATRGY